MINLLKVIVLNWSFVQREIEAQCELARSEERPKVFQAAQRDVLETMADDIEKKATELAGKKLSELLSPIDWSHVVRMDEKRGLVFIGDEQADPERLLSLKSEAELIESTTLWKLLTESPNALAQQTMFRTGEDIDAFKKGRALIYFIETQKKILSTLRSYQHNKQ